MQAIEKNRHKRSDIHHTLNPTLERYIKQQKEHLCGKYIENHQKKIIVKVVIPSRSLNPFSLTPLPDLLFVAKIKN